MYSLMRAAWQNHKQGYKMNIRVVGLVCASIFLGASGCAKKSEVVVYTALDQEFSEPIFQAFEKETGIHVLAKYDTESTKTVGLVNTIIAESSNPRCDVFWNNEIVNTIRLKDKNLLQPCAPENAPLFPTEFRAPDNTWFGFAARARILIVNTNLVPDSLDIRSIFDLTKSELMGKIGIAKPLFGTTATQMACLYAVLGPEKTKSWLMELKTNKAIVESGNKMCAVDVAQGNIVAALTDTDDAIGEMRNGAPVKIIFPDSRDNGIGTLLIPNTLSLVKGCPNPQEGLRLINYLLSPAVEEKLARGDSAQIPLNSQASATAHPLSPLPASWMKVDFSAAAQQFEPAAQWIQETFMAP